MSVGIGSVGTGSAEQDAPAPDIRILSGQPSPEEIAAVTAVLTMALDELAGETRRRRASGQSAWQRSQRDIRRPLPFGAWRNLDL